MTDLELLKEATECLLKSACTFFACEGYEDEPIDMVTCGRCYMLHQIFKKHPEWKPEGGA